MHYRYALIVAGGSGTRMGSSVPKQFLNLMGRPVLMHTIEVFNSVNPAPNIVLVLPTNQFALWREQCAKHNFKIEHQLVAGGETRYHSVKNGLAHIQVDCLVAIHDGVRPLVTKTLIEKCFEIAEREGSAIPAVKPHESIRSGEFITSKKENRDLFWLVQTPQVFRIEEIKEAYKVGYQHSFTDDASVYEAVGKSVFIVEGERENIKITTPIDLVIAESIIEYKEKKRSNPE